MTPISSFQPPAATEGPAHVGSETAAGMGKTSTALQAADVSLDIRLFGRASVSAGGVPVKFAKRATTLAMLALILLQRGQTISRESLAFTLFPEADETSALAELRRYLYLANKSLPARPDDPWLIGDSGA